jgi:GntR family transcriptional repressor for pyruvate dehydrogenase complex
VPRLSDVWKNADVSTPLRPVTRPRLYQQVVARLREHVESEGLRAGDRLPPERELATKLGVSRASVKQAMVALEVQGLVDVRHGGGAFLLTDSLEAESLEAMRDRQKNLPDVLDARDALETKLAALAAVRRTESDLQEIDDALAAMRTAIDRGELGKAEDERFHHAVTAGAHSALLARFMDEIATSIEESRAESLRQPGRPPKSLDQHRKVAAAIRDQDPVAAASSMHDHVDNVGRVRLLEWNAE